MELKALLVLLLRVQQLTTVNGKAEKPVNADNEDSADEAEETPETPGTAGMSTHFPQLTNFRGSKEEEEEVQEEEDRRGWSY